MGGLLRSGVFAAVGFFLATAGFAEEARQARIAAIQGGVFMRAPNGEWQPAQVGNILREKDEIRTVQGGFAELLLDEGQTGRLELKENSYFAIHTLGADPQTGDQQTLLDLALGKVRVYTEKLKGDSKFEVRTPTSTTGVRGTVFEVSVEEEKGK